jgi:hypothetical protein
MKSILRILMTVENDTDTAILKIGYLNRNMATQEERQLLRHLQDVDSAVNVTEQYLRKFRQTLFSGQYRKNFLNSKGKFDADLGYLGGVFANSDRQVLEAIDLARANNIMPEIIDNINHLNDNMAESYDKVINASQDRAIEHRAQISARVDETINILKKLQESIRELSGALEERVPANLVARMAARPPANNRNGGFRKRTHRKRTHHKRKHYKRRTHRK